MTFEITGEARHLKNLFSAIAIAADEARLTVGLEEMKLRGHDPSKYTMLDAAFPKSTFEKYNCETEVTLGFRTDEIKNVIKRAKDRPEDKITMSLGQNSRLTFTFEDKKYACRLIEASVTEGPLPKFDMPLSIEMPYAQLKELLDDAAYEGHDYDYGDNVLRIDGKDGKVTFFRRTDTTEFEAIKTNGEVWKVSGEGNGPFSIELFANVVKAIIAKKVTLKLGDYTPMLAIFDEGYIKYYIAPRAK